MHDPDMFAKRAASFGSNATAYAKHRPRYADEAVEWVVGDHTRVLDLAAGTGKLTETLLEFALEVTAVEPDDQMRAELTRLLPDVPALKGTAEQIPFPDASFDAVVTGQAFHWFDTPEALAEITRVLRPGGVFGALWNYDDLSVPWVAGLAELVGNAQHEEHTPRHERLAEAERRTWRHSQRRTVESMLASLGTLSRMLVVEEAERVATFDKLRTYLWSRPETSQGEFERPMLTTAVRAVRI
ncbi:ubiquinone/menaquinone biosynthesis C-methylase UbiE [Actinokineospora baliensis]|uniref:class I SAM-dependent methyltransferase n=1 Tax=Actinokineospora baliensis TaxID=547056 RepID=UPI00195D9FC8|nr:class I SAM-dependent methyltransferase [Actinokineospora baliensis]MBM7771454.1 ubiquinone/menaquinone biosynthesis C-methylase UbiE [Actinokineospora baliensis]